MTGYRVLVCSAGTSPAMGIVKCFSRLVDRPSLIVTTDLVEDAGAAALSDRHYVVPPYSSPEYFPALRAIVEKEDIGVIFPTHLDELLYLARHEAVLPDWYRRMAVLNPANVVLLANDKRAMNALWEKAGGEVPGTFSSASELKEADFPVFVKPAFGRSRGYELVHRIDDLAALQAHGKIAGGAMIQKCVKGVEYSIDFVADSGQILGLCTRTRERTERGLCVQGTTVAEKKFRTVVERVIEILPAIRFGNIQVIRDDRGRDHFIEVNPKLPGTLVHSAAAGLVMPLMLAEMAMGVRPRLVSVRAGVRMVRYYEEFYQSGSNGWRGFRETFQGVRDATDETPLAAGLGRGVRG